MRIVSIGDLVIDYYYKNDKLLGINGGMTCHNIIVNLAKMGFDTSLFGVCGNDMQGEIAIKSLDLLNVDINNITKLDDNRTRCFHVSYFEENGKLSFTSKKRCPFCNSKHWYENSLIDSNYVLNNVKNDDILVFDNLNEVNQKIIDNTSNKKIIDLGQYFEFENLNNEEIVKKINGKFEIINFNERVSKFLIKKLELKSDLELFNILNPILMTITRGSDGATFIFSKKVLNFELTSSACVVDSTGAGDAFISSIIKSCLKSNFDYNESNLKKWYLDSIKLTSKVVSKMGARGHLNTLFRIKKVNNFCTCDNFEYSERKKIKRCNININNLEKRIVNAINTSACTKINDINFCNDDNCLFIGTGGSYSGTYFSAKIINKLYGCNTYSLYPRDVLYRNNEKINKILLFSYSGTTGDIINVYKNLSDKKFFMITKGEASNIVLKTGFPKKNIYSYRSSTNKSRERGFLSFEGAVVPATIFLKYYYSIVDKNFDVDKFVKDSLSYWNKQLDELINDKIIEKLNKTKQINLFRGDYADTACYDLESKIIESGIANCIIHEKKNFSHGRFVNYENLNNDFSIYFKQKNINKYENELLNYLSDNTLIIESNYDGILSEYDLLIASQFIIYYIGKRLDIDVSKPKYSEEAMKIYFYKGDL